MLHINLEENQLNFYLLCFLAGWQVCVIQRSLLRKYPSKNKLIAYFFRNLLPYFPCNILADAVTSSSVKSSEVQRIPKSYKFRATFQSAVSTQILPFNNCKENVHSVTLFSVVLYFNAVWSSAEILTFPAISFPYVSILSNFLGASRMVEVSSVFFISTSRVALPASIS